MIERIDEMWKDSILGTATGVMGEYGIAMKSEGE